MRVFMIGGTGLPGSEAANELIARGHELSGIALPPLPTGAVLPPEMKIGYGNYPEMTDDDIDAAVGDSILLCKDVIEKKTQVLIALGLVMLIWPQWSLQIIFKWVGIGLIMTGLIKGLIYFTKRIKMSAARPIC